MRDTIDMAREAGWDDHHAGFDTRIDRLVALVRADERALAASVQVSPLEFVTMVMEKEHLVGKPLFWAEWPNKEKNT